jgi:hypothetical protein
MRTDYVVRKLQLLGGVFVDSFPDEGVNCYTVELNGNFICFEDVAGVVRNLTCRRFGPGDDGDGYELNSLGDAIRLAVGDISRN